MPYHNYAFWRTPKLSWPGEAPWLVWSPSAQIQWSWKCCRTLWAAHRRQSLFFFHHYQLFRLGSAKPTGRVPSQALFPRLSALQFYSPQFGALLLCRYSTLLIYWDNLWIIQKIGTVRMSVGEVIGRAAFGVFCLIFWANLLFQVQMRIRHLSCGIDLVFQIQID